jgi:aspartate/methionine/tyrosine aminotransferase
MRFASRTKKIKSLIPWAGKLAKQPGVINLTQGKPNFPIPEEAVKEVREKVREGWASRYGASKGLPELREKVLKNYEKEGVPVEDVIITSGAIEGFLAAMLTFVDPGDEVILIAPYYGKYKAATHITNTNAVSSPYKKTDDKFVFDLQAFKRSITRKTKVVVVNSPCNPTGTVFRKEDLEAILELAKENGFFIIYDEVYKKLLFDDYKHYNKEIYDPDHTILLDSFSKIYSMSGWRVGSLVGSEKVLAEISKLHAPLVVCPSTMSQIAALAALKTSEKYLKDNLKEYEKRRKATLDGASKIPEIKAYKPGGGMFVMMEVENCKNDMMLVKDIVNKSKVGLVPGVGFAAPGFLRLSFGSADAEQIEEAFNRLQVYFKEKYPKYLKSREKPY